MDTKVPAGIISPYGIFFPTNVGPAALVTMPDIDNGQRGTGIVNVVKLQLDVNHDGKMDLSFGGPDNTSQAHPLEFWINNDNDGTGVGADTDPGTNTDFMDYSYHQIRSWRNLEDFARMWICGVPPLPFSLTQNSSPYNVTLSWQNAVGNPAINLYRSCETNGGIGYLTSTNIAATQILNNAFLTYGTNIGTVSTNAPYVFPNTTFIFGGTQYLLFEGAGVGSGQLVLTIFQGTNIVAQTSQWLDLHDVGDFWEQAFITNDFSDPNSTNWHGVLQSVDYAAANATGDDENLIVFVHGFHVTDSRWRELNATSFKRLYWSGFNGRFATVRWPCETSYLAFDISEENAYVASTGLTTYLNQLRTRFPNYRLNLFTGSQGPAIVCEALSQGAPFDNLLITQGAVAASSFDINAPTDTDLVAAESSSPTPDFLPMGYRGVYTNITGGPIINFYNPLDSALETGTLNWKVDQLGKPDYSYGSDGTYVWQDVDDLSTNIPIPITDSRISRARVARSRTWAIGAQGLGAGETNQGIIKGTLDLNAQFGFGRAGPDHDAQCNWPIQTAWPYYQQVLLQFKPQP